MLDLLKAPPLLLIKVFRLMTTKIQWLGHSCFYIESDSHKILIDPFLTGNPAASLKAADLKADFILVSHGHGDHVGDTIEIAKRCNSTVICNYEISGWMESKASGVWSRRRWCTSSSAASVHQQQGVKEA